MQNFALRTILNSIISIALAAATLPAQAAPTKKWKPADFKPLAEAAIARPINFADSLQLMALSGASKESLAAIYKDYQHRAVKAGNAPEFKMVNGKLFAGGKPTGIEIRSYAPGKIGLNGKTWVYDAKKTSDQNYFALVKFLEGKKSASNAVNWLLPQAEAQIDRVQYALDGVMIGWYAGAIVGVFASFAACMLAAPVCGVAGVAMAVGGGFSGAFLGGAYGASVYDQTHGVLGAPRIECDEKGMRIQNWNMLVREIFFDRATGNVNAQSAAFPLGMTKETKEALRELGESCNNSADAGQILSTMDPAAKSVKEIIMSGKPAEPAEEPAASDS